MPVDKDVQKEALKEALKEWLDEQAAKVGKLTIKWALMAIFAGAVYIWLTVHGLKVPS